MKPEEQYKEIKMDAESIVEKVLNKSMNYQIL